MEVKELTGFLPISIKIESAFELLILLKGLQHMAKPYPHALEMFDAITQVSSLSDKDVEDLRNWDKEIKFKGSL